MKNYKCLACGYVYKPDEHDNVAFEDLAENWICPICGVDKSMFEAE